MKGALPELNGSHSAVSQGYLTGLRGVLAISSFAWLWLQTFVPTVTSEAVSGPLYQAVLRKIFMVLFFDQGLIVCFLVALSARTCCVHFLHDPSPSVYARSLISRPIRIGIPTSLALAISIAIFSTIDTSYIKDAAVLLENPLLEAPSKPATPLAAFNSIYDLLWLVRDFPQQQGNQAWPSKTLWVPSLIYSQSYTVYISMVVLPFTRPGWHLEFFLLFSLGSFWFNSWGWLSSAGLFVADLSINPTLRARLRSGARVSENFSFPYWILAALSVMVGLALKYIWTAALPQYANRELILHPALDGLSSNDGTWQEYDTSYPYPRLDNYLVILGVLVTVEMSDLFKKLLCAEALMFLGRRSMSLFVASTLLIYTVGLKLFLKLHVGRHLSIAGSNAVVLITLIPTVLLTAEVFYRFVDQPSSWAATWFFGFLTR
ncbi:hypothetical protein BDV97DRAFT_289731 [Delphinella strobiligena]|nr:hypothetical protein BDV97DRAFT_289731 [Delphinella strobiligena]